MDETSLACHLTARLAGQLLVSGMVLCVLNLINQFTFGFGCTQHTSPHSSTTFRVLVKKVKKLAFPSSSILA